MSCKYETVERDGHTLDVLFEEAEGTQLIVDRLGAQPISLIRAFWGMSVGFLSRDNDLTTPPAGVWGEHCLVMGYYIHRLLNQRTTYRGHELRGGTHSFLRNTTFAAPVFADGADGGSLTYTITPDDYRPDEYPYRVTLRLTYILRPGGVWRTRFRFESGEPDVSTHVSFGLHPGFYVKELAGAKITMAPGRYRRHFAPGNFLSGETVDIDHPGGDIPFDRTRLIDSYLLELVDVKEPLFEVTDSEDGRRVVVDCSQAPYVTLWSNGNDFICVEPCWGLPDAHKQVPFEQKAGIQEIPPGGTLEREMGVTANFSLEWANPRYAYT